MDLEQWEEELLEVAERRLERGQISRSEFVRLLGLLGFSAAVPGVLAGRATAAAEQAGDRVRFLIAENFWANWEPYQNTAQSQFRINEQIYDRLVDFPTGDIGKPAPMLATSWRQQSPTRWEFKLRQGVKFHGGQDFTARDVKASIERASGATKVKTVDAGLFWVPTTVRVVDDETVRLQTKQPFGALFSALQHTHIVSAQDLAGPVAALKRRPNGTGPFRLVGNAPTKKTMVRNEAYWRAPAQIQQLVWEFVQDAQTRLNALLAGQAHAIDRVPPEHLAIIAGRRGLALASRTGIEMVNLWVRPGRAKFWEESLPFRQAVNWSINRDALVRSLVKGRSRAARSVIPSGTLYWQAQTPKYGFNPARAKAALQRSGVGDQPFELWVAKGFLPRAVEVVESIVDSMKQVGLNPQVRTADVAGVIDDIFSKKGTGLMYHLSWSSNGDPMTAFQVYSPAFAWYFGDKTIAKLIEDGMHATSPGRRARIYDRLQRHMWSQLWHVPLYYSDFTVGHTSRLRGLRVTQNFGTYFYPARLV
jgi:peptide/nickel transport system substrate-binding protein